jgi:hypothetical protein
MEAFAALRPPSYAYAIQGSVPVRDKRYERYFFSETSRTRSVAHPASYSVRTGVYLSRIKRPRREVGHLSPCNADVKN